MGLRQLVAVKAAAQMLTELRVAQAAVVAVAHLLVVLEAVIQAHIAQ
jgi:hypothetical protein